MAKLSTIEGVGPSIEKKLKAAGVGSTNSLLQMGATKKGRQQISEASGLDAGRVLKFVNHCDLMRIKGVGGEYSELLEAAGVDTVPELKRRNAANLAAAMQETNASKKLVRVVPGSGTVANWVEQAKGLAKIVTH